MKDHVISDELAILKDTLVKRWYSFSTKRQIVKI